MKSYNNSSPLTPEICELREEISYLKIERKALYFIATCGVSFAVFEFSPLAAIILLVGPFSFCFLKNIVKGQ